MAKERQCIACLNTYKYCPTCGEFAKYPTWMTEYDTEECKEVFNAISGFNMGIKKAEDVKNVIDKFGITDFNKFKPTIASKLNELFGKKSTVAEKPEIVSEVEANTAPVETLTQEPTVEELICESEEDVAVREYRPRKRRINRINED